MDIRLKVNTEELRRVSELISKDITVADDSFRDIYSIIDNSISHWEGEAADMARKMFNKKKNDVDTVIKRLKEHPTDLMRMAGIYDVAEKQSIDAGNVLKTDVII